MLRKNDENISCTPRKNHRDQKSTQRTWFNGPKSLRAHSTNTQASPGETNQRQNGSEQKTVLELDAAQHLASAKWDCDRSARHS